MTVCTMPSALHFGDYCVNIITQHHSWDCSLATPMITNIDSEVHAHVHEDAVRWEVGGGGGGYLLSASHFYHLLSFLLWTVHMLTCRSGRVSLCVQGVMNHLDVHAWCIEAQPFFLSAWSRPASCVCAMLNQPRVKLERVSRIKAEMRPFYCQHKRKFHRGQQICT